MALGRARQVTPGQGLEERWVEANLAPLSKATFPTLHVCLGLGVGGGGGSDVEAGHGQDRPALVSAAQHSTVTPPSQPEPRPQLLS